MVTKTYEKKDGTKFIESYNNPTTVEYDLEELKKQKQQHQEAIDRIDELLAEASKLGLS